MTPQEIFERHIWTGMTGNAEMRANLYAHDGVYEAPLAPENGTVPRRLEGRDALRAGFTKMHRLAQSDPRKPDMPNSHLVLHTTSDPDVFIAELDAAFENAATMPLLQIYRLHDGEIVLMRDYFDPNTFN